MTWKYKLKNILIAWAASVLLVAISIFCIYQILPVNYFGEINIFGGISFFNEKFKEFIFPFFGACILAPVVEELIFRHLPMSIIKHRADYQLIKLPIVLAVSCIFGWMHGSELNVLIQGIVGLCLFWVYIKNGHCVISSMIVHSMYNFALFMALINFH